MTDNISLPSSGSFFGKIRILCLIISNQLNSSNENLKNPMVIILARLGQKRLVIWKVNHSAHLISLESLLCNCNEQPLPIYENDATCDVTNQT